MIADIENETNTPIRGLSAIFKKAPSLSCRFLKYTGNWRNLIGWFRRLETKKQWIFMENQNPGLVYFVGVYILVSYTRCLFTAREILFSYTLLLLWYFNFWITFCKCENYRELYTRIYTFFYHWIHFLWFWGWTFF